MKEEDGGGEEVGEEWEAGREEDKEGGRVEEQEERVLGQARGDNTME